MLLNNKEHYDLITYFEKQKIGIRYDKEPKELWSKSHIYQHGETNNLFLAYRQGYSLAKSIYQD